MFSSKLSVAKGEFDRPTYNRGLIAGVEENWGHCRRAAAASSGFKPSVGRLLPVGIVETVTFLPYLPPRTSKMIERLRGGESGCEVEVALSTVCLMSWTIIAMDMQAGDAP